MNINNMAEQKIRIAIKYNKVIDYLEGKGIYKVNVDPRDINSPHAYDFCIECYNKFFAKNPQLGLDKLFETEIITKLSSNKCNFFDVYCLFNCLVAQLKLEKKNNSSFKISKEQLKEILGLLKKQTLINQEDLEICKSEKGFEYNDGMYGYIFEENNKFYEETGHKIL